MTVVDVARATHSMSSWQKPGPITQLPVVARGWGHDPDHNQTRWLWVLAFARTTARKEWRALLPSRRSGAAQNKNAPRGGRLPSARDGRSARTSVLFEEARKLLLEPRHTAATVHQLLGAAGPGRVRLGVDVEVQRVAFLAPGRAGQVLGAVGHDDLNRMIIRVNLGFHGNSFGASAPVSRHLGYGIWRLYTPRGPLKQAKKPSRNRLKPITGLGLWRICQPGVRGPI